MKLNLLLFCLVISTQIVFSQKIYFARSNYSDSAAFEKIIPELAKQLVGKYKESDTCIYSKNLGYLYLTAKEYGKVNEQFDRYAAFYPSLDSSQKIAAEMPARVYCRVISNSVTNFENNYVKAFIDIYLKLNMEAVLDVDYYYDVAIGEKSKQLSGTISSFKMTKPLTQ